MPDTKAPDSESTESTESTWDALSDSALASLREFFSSRSPDCSRHCACGGTSRLCAAVRGLGQMDLDRLADEVRESSEAWPPARSAPSWFSSDGLPSYDGGCLRCSPESQ